MDNKPSIKWHAQELYRLLSQDPNDMLTAKIMADLETIFFNSHPYKDVEAKQPELK